MTVGEAIAYLDQVAGDGRNGLPEELFLFISRVTPVVNVDLLIQDEQRRTLLTWREDDFYGAGWHVPGGIIRYKEHAAERIRRCAEEEIGSAVSFEPEPIAITESIGEQRDRGHFISMLYRCRLLSEPDPDRKAGVTPQRAEWKWHDGCPADLLPAHKVYAQFI